MFVFIEMIQYLFYTKTEIDLLCFIRAPSIEGLYLGLALEIIELLSEPCSIASNKVEHPKIDQAPWTTHVE
jgi:hypothetical protein